MRARTAALAAAGLLLAGCGIPTTGVVEAGEPAHGLAQTVTLFFVRAGVGTLATVSRTSQSEADAGTVVTMLLRGLAPAEQKLMGLTTDLPAGTFVAGVGTRDGAVVVRLHVPQGRLTGTAADQVVCTVLANHLAGMPDAGPAEVAVTADGVPVTGQRPRKPCPFGDAAMPFKPGDWYALPDGGVSGR